MRKPLYGLWQKDEHGHWRRQFPFLAFTRELAIRKFQDVLIYQGGELRVVGHTWRTR